MQSLAKIYCRELLSQLDQLPVYLPGRNVQVGDVITFGNIHLFTRPLGDFQVVTTLDELKVKVTTRVDAHSDSYRYASKSGTSLSFEPSVAAGSDTSGTLKIAFQREGSLYLAALGCQRTEMINVHTLKEQLVPHRNALDWNNCYIVTSVTHAERAIVMQSNSTNAELELTGHTKNLTPGASVSVAASIDFSLKSYRDASFIKDWSGIAPVFMTLARFKRSFIGSWSMNARNVVPIDTTGDPLGYALIDVTREEILEDEEAMV